MSKPLFWTNLVSLVVTGALATGLALAWNNPTANPVSGSGALTVDSAGNVGIGTPSPTSKLHLTGKLRLVDGTQGISKFLTSDASGVASWSTPTKGATLERMDTWGINDDVKTCTSIFSSLNAKSGLSGAAKTAVGGHARVFTATDGRWLFVVTAEDCSPEDNKPGGYGLIPRTATGAAIPGYWSYKGAL